MAAKQSEQAEQRQRFRALLEEKGLRVTQPRLVVLRELHRLRGAISHAELVERLAPHGLDRVTLYRNLVALAEVGILVRTHLGDHVWRYELPRSSARPHNAHPHFVCVDCGNVSCLPDNAVTLHAAAAKRGLVEVQLRGHCGDCVHA